MEPMTLDEAKAAAMRIETYRSELSRTYAEGIAVVLADALRDAEAQVAALTAKLATARADAIEEAAKAMETECHCDDIRGRCPFCSRAAKIRALATNPPAEPPAAEAPLLSGIRIVRHCNADNGLAVCTFEQGHDGPHSWPPPFDARRFAEALVEGLTAPHANVALRDDGQAVHIVREAVRRALDAGSSK